MQVRRMMFAMAAAPLLAVGTASADGMGLNPSFAVMGGGLWTTDSDLRDDPAYGLEIGSDCLLFQPDNGVLRHRLSVTEFDDGPLRMTSTELNTHWEFEVADSVTMGFGPGLGYVNTKLDGDRNGLWAGQFGGSVQYDVDDTLFVGMEARYQITESDRFAGSREDMDNMRVMAKVGFNF
ncbi:outer membrane beta-barrel protein [Thioalkalivibrio sp. ALE23]|uniref:outer membrane beta-barrel protein n=1 Tax=Thioalkalivibrio sp. ALE23 TaxID=1265495 RepID=UPI0004759F68|nr:outer membrane beta-barrel protein [Thioalkalivibrio sp. ALE23]